MAVLKNELVYNYNKQLINTRFRDILVHDVDFGKIIGLLWMVLFPSFFALNFLLI